MTLVRDPALQNTTLSSIDMNVTLTGSAGGDVHKPTLKFTAAASYAYPCVRAFTAHASIDVDVEGAEIPAIEGSMKVYCPGMKPEERLQRAFEIRAAFAGEFEAKFGGVTVTVAQFAMVVNGVDSDVTPPGVSSRSWVPLPSFSAVDIEVGGAVQVDSPQPWVCAFDPALAIN